MPVPDAALSRAQASKSAVSLVRAKVKVATRPASLKWLLMSLMVTVGSESAVARRVKVAGSLRKLAPSACMGSPPLPPSIRR